MGVRPFYSLEFTFIDYRSVDHTGSSFYILVSDVTGLGILQLLPDGCHTTITLTSLVHEMQAQIDLM